MDIEQRMVAAAHDLLDRMKEEISEGTRIKATYQQLTEIENKLVDLRHSRRMVSDLEAEFSEEDEAETGEEG